MRKALLLRIETSEQGTFGSFSTAGFSCLTSELPWRDNVKTLSCIPPGIYMVIWTKSPKFGWCYKLQRVPSRDSILIHSGNFVGDISRGYKSNSHGCILPALKRGYMNKQKVGLMSTAAVLRLNAFMNKEPFLLEIKNAFNTTGNS